QSRRHVSRRMIAVYGAIKALFEEKTRGRALLAKLRAQALLHLVEFFDGKTRMEQNVERHGEPLIEVVAQPRCAQHRVRRAEGSARAQDRAKAVDLLGNLNAAPCRRALAKHLRGG